MSVRRASKDVEDVRRAWRDASLAPLWESPVAHKPAPAADAPHRWAWDMVRPLIGQAMDVVSPEDVERRVLVLANPARPEERATLRTISAALQILLPGESARPHRHSMSALRFVLEGSGAVTTVDGKNCPMEEGDLVLTPGWCWHEHLHQGAKPIIWLDVLDAPLHRYLGTAVFEPGPVTQLPEVAPDSAFAASAVVPEVAAVRRDHSPIFRYPYRAVVAAVAAAPVSRDGARRVRYVNPLTGGSALSLIDSTMMQLDPATETTPFRTTSNAICTVVEGTGESTIGECTIAWGPNDVFTLPKSSWITHRAAADTARLFVVSDREILAKLGLLEEEYGAGLG